MSVLRKLFLGLLLFICVPQVVHAQTTVASPTLYCLGANCNPTTTIDISSQPTIASVTVPATPCQTTAIEHRRRGGFLKDIFQLLLLFMDLILKVLGSDSVSAPCSPAPTPSPVATSPAPVSIEPTLASPSGAIIAPTSLTCTKPVWSSSDPNGQWSNRGYFVFNNMWNASSYPDTKQTVSVCAYNNWVVTASATDSGDGAVKTYPDTHKDYNKVAISSLSSMTSTYAHVAPSGGNWNFAYDIWINGIGNGNGSTELMIWTEAKGKQADAVNGYATIASVTLGGTAYNIKKNGSSYIVYKMTTYKNSGTVDLKAIMQDLITRGLIPGNSTVDQVDYGVEIVDSGGANQQFKLINFSVTP